MVHIINDINDPAVSIFAGLTEAQLRNDVHPERGIFIAESPKVIRIALQAGYQPISLLCEKKHIQGDAAEIIAANPLMPVYTASREVLKRLTGYTLTRGVLCAFHRPKPRSVAETIGNARRVAVLESVCDTTNTGAIFRSAAALGIDTIVLSSDACDPLNRRVVRVSMGTIFLIPWCTSQNPVAELKDLGFTTVAMALREDDIAINDPRLKSIERLALIVGTEGDGLREETIAAADYVARIPMSHRVDSLNVAAAAAIAFWECQPR